MVINKLSLRLLLLHHQLAATSTPTRLFSLLSSSRKLQNTRTGTRRDAFFAHPIKTRTSLFSSTSAAEAMEFEADEIHDEVMKTTEKHHALCTAVKLVDDDWGKKSKVSLERFFRTRSASVISTGSLALDEALGIGGLPKMIFEKPFS